MFRRGQLALIAAGPGTGKSAVTLTLALRSRVPTLYLSADSDAFEQLYRSICVLTGTTTEIAKRAVLSGDIEEYTEALAGIPIRFNYEASPSLDTIELQVAAYEEVYGEYPHLIIVDNLMNVRSESEEDDRDGLMSYLHDMARQTGACVAVLHHVTGPYNDADKPIPLSGVKGQVTAVPEMVLTLHARRDEGQPDLLCVSPVKLRGGKPDPSGRRYTELEFDGGRMTIRDAA